MFLCAVEGLVLIVLNVAIHGIGTTAWTRYIVNHKAVSDSLMKRGILMLILTAILLLMLHTIEVLLWALIYLATPTIAEIVDLEKAIYFSMITFTTLGYGDITISGEWQLLSGWEAMNGILMFGWSTALLFAVVQHLWQFEAGRHSLSSPIITGSGQILNSDPVDSPE